jgi:hypothetical protein
MQAFGWEEHWLRPVAPKLNQYRLMLGTEKLVACMHACKTSERRALGQWDPKGRCSACTSIRSSEWWLP